MSDIASPTIAISMFAVRWTKATKWLTEIVFAPQVTLMKHQWRRFFSRCDNQTLFDDAMQNFNQKYFAQHLLCGYENLFSFFNVCSIWCSGLIARRTKIINSYAISFFVHLKVSKHSFLWCSSDTDVILGQTGGECLVNALSTSPVKLHKVTKKKMCTHWES